MGAKMIIETPAFRFFVFGLGYATASIILAVLVRESVLGVISRSLQVATGFPLQMFTVFGLVLAFGVVRAARGTSRTMAQAALQITFAYAGAIALHFGFMLFKTGMPHLFPYFADPMLAEIDAWLHGGTDAWRIVDSALGPEFVLQLLPVYQLPWVFLAFLFPVFLVATDDDTARTGRFLILYCAGWLLIGNLLALAGLSVGPIYYDRLLDEERFADLQRSLDLQGVDQLFLGKVQDFLWDMYANGTFTLGSGISAFPSVHVAIAMTVALYCVERSVLLALPGIAFGATIFILSVWTGYHYAIDGYVSILAMLGLWSGLRAAGRRHYRGQGSPQGRIRETLQP